MAAGAHGSSDSCRHVYKFVHGPQLCCDAWRYGSGEAARAIRHDRLHRTHHGQDRRGIWFDGLDHAG